MALTWECPHCHYRNSEKSRVCKKCRKKPDSKDVVWWVDLRDGKDKRIRKRVGKNKSVAIILEAELKKRKAERQVALALGKEAPETSLIPTFEVFWIKYFLWCRSQNKDVVHKQARWKNHLRKRFGSKLLNEITANDVRKYQMERLNEGASPATINREVALLKHMLNMAVKWGYLERNPLEGKIGMLKENTERWTYLMPEEAERIKQHLSETYHDLFDFLLYTGLRLGDALRLQWQDINLEGRFILVRGTKTKGGKTFGIPLNQKALEVLRSRLQKADRINKEDRVFKHSEREFRRAFKKAVKLAGLPETIRVHDLRHTFASWLAMSGVTIQEIQALLGHSQITTTLRYAHLNPTVLLNASEAAVKFSASRKGFAFSPEGLKSNDRDEYFSLESDMLKDSIGTEFPDCRLRH